MRRCGGSLAQFSDSPAPHVLSKAPRGFASSQNPAASEQKKSPHEKPYADRSTGQAG